VATTDTERLQSEHEALLAGCALVDRSERGKLALTGAGAVEFLNGQITNELTDLDPGEGRYATFLTNKGKMLGDLRVLAVGADETITELLLDTERVALQALFDMIRRYKIGYEVELHKRTLECALLSLVGPRSAAVLAGARGDVATDLPRDKHPDLWRDEHTDLPPDEHRHVKCEIAGRPARVIATDAGGIDVLCASADRDVVVAALLAAGAVATDEQAAEVVRVERGRPRYGVDLDDSTIPQEAGLNERAVSFTKGCYVGQETVARLYYKGKPNRHLRGLRIAGAADAVTAGAELRLGERAVGRLGSFVHSPTHGPIGLALVRREAAPGDVVAVGADGVTATVVELPFS
jgi:folate-binding protein YgfZ